MVNSMNKGKQLRSFCGNGFGDAKCDSGSERRSRRTGGSMRIAGRDRCESIASVKREGEDWPGKCQNKAAQAKYRTYPAKRT
jgi:hypothetical protein